jgi:hypothetical protein
MPASDSLITTAINLAASFGFSAGRLPESNKTTAMLAKENCHKPLFVSTLSKCDSVEKDSEASLALTALLNLALYDIGRAELKAQGITWKSGDERLIGMAIGTRSHTETLNDVPAQQLIRHLNEIRAEMFGTKDTKPVMWEAELVNVEGENATDGAYYIEAKSNDMRSILMYEAALTMAKLQNIPHHVEKSLDGETARLRIQAAGMQELATIERLPVIERQKPK